MASKNNTNHNDPIGLTEAAKILKIAPSTFRGIVDSGEYPADCVITTVRGRYYFLKSQVLAFKKTFKKRGRGRPMLNPDDKVRALGRCTEEELERWKAAAHKALGLNDEDIWWPWAREILNKAAENA